MNDKNKKIGLFSLIMMIFSSIFGFANMPVAFLQMGYASIIWYIFAAIFFFLPVSMMLAEYGSAFKDEQGGIYAWLSNTIGEKLAFIGTFIWLSSWIVWLINISSKVFIPFSALLFGKDMTQTWAFGPFSATQVVGILAILWIIFVTFFASRGADVISKVSSIGGTFVTGMIFVFLIATFISLFVTHGHFEQPITASAFVKSPNPAFTNPVATLSFVVYAIFAYAGMESLGGMIDNIEEPEKTFPKGLLISSILIAVAYSFMILLWGVSVNWKDVLSSDFVNLGNITYIMMQHLGIYLGHSLGLSASVSNLIGNIFIRFVGLGMFLAYVGSFFILIFLISFGGGQAKSFYTILTDMSNVSTSFPYLFLVGAFPVFKKKGFKQPFIAYKNHTWTKIVTYICFLIILFGIIFTCVDPFIQGDWVTGFWTVIGPIFFGSLALGIYTRATKKNNN